MWTDDELRRMYASSFRRKSIRKYAPEPLREDVVSAILAMAENANAPLPGSGAAFRMLTPAEVKGSAPKAPHYLALYTEANRDSKINGACKLQQVELMLSAMGYGCCWLGMPRPIAEVSNKDMLPYQIMLSVGKPTEPLYRDGVAQFRRSAYGEITDAVGMEKLLEPVRLAPSAVNRQPWFVKCHGDILRLFEKQGNLVSKNLFGDMQCSDIGIALAHLWLSATVTHGKTAEFLKENSTSIDSPRGYNYAWSVIVQA